MEKELTKIEDDIQVRPETRRHFNELMRRTIESLKQDVESKKSLDGQIPTLNYFLDKFQEFVLYDQLRKFQFRADWECEMDEELSQYLMDKSEFAAFYSFTGIIYEVRGILILLHEGNLKYVLSDKYIDFVKDPEMEENNTEELKYIKRKNRFLIDPYTLIKYRETLQQIIASEDNKDVIKKIFSAMIAKQYATYEGVKFNGTTKFLDETFMEILNNSALDTE